MFAAGLEVKVVGKESRLADRPTAGHPAWTIHSETRHDLQSAFRSQVGKRETSEMIAKGTRARSRLTVKSLA